MKQGETNELLELGGVVRRTYSSVIANAGKIIAAITLSVAVLVTFTDMAFSDLRSAELTTTLIVMLVSAYLMYFSLEDSGEKEGEESEEYKVAIGKYLDFREKITPGDIDGLREFCLDYAKRELEYRRLAYLCEMGYSESDLNSYKAGVKYPKRAVRAFKKAERMRAVRLSPAILLSRAHGRVKSELWDPSYKKLTASLTSLIPSTVCMVFTVSVILTAKDNLTVSTVIDGLVKLSCLPIIGFKGTLDGYRFTREDKSAWLDTKARLLEAYLNSKLEVRNS